MGFTAKDLPQLGGGTVKELFAYQPGPLPLTTPDFKSKGGRLVIFVSGSGFREVSKLLSCKVSINKDGGAFTEVGRLNTFTNEALSHKTLVPRQIIIPPELSLSGSHSFKIESVDLTTDFNDFFNLVVYELQI